VEDLLALLGSASVEDMVKLFTGKAGTLVTLRIDGAGEPKPLEFTLRRAEIEAHICEFIGAGGGPLHRTDGLQRLLKTDRAGRSKAYLDFPFGWPGAGWAGSKFSFVPFSLA
jgi:hypothetical protein